MKLLDIVSQVYIPLSKITGWIIKPNSNVAQLTTLYIIER